VESSIWVEAGSPEDEGILRAQALLLVQHAHAQPVVVARARALVLARGHRKAAWRGNLFRDVAVASAATAKSAAPSRDCQLSAVLFWGTECACAVHRVACCGCEAPGPSAAFTSLLASARRVNTDRLILSTSGIGEQSRPSCCAAAVGRQRVRSAWRSGGGDRCGVCVGGMPAAHSGTRHIAAHSAASESKEAAWRTPIRPSGPGWRRAEGG
jgi:hypothetical protein